MVVDRVGDPAALAGAGVDEGALREVDRAVGGDVRVEREEVAAAVDELAWVQVAPASCDWAAHGSPPVGPLNDT